jgi:RNA polymerase sigma-70 factor (ECF subfamily)
MPSVIAPRDFEQLIAAHRGILIKVAATYSQHADDRADLVQDIALQLWRAWPRYERDRPFSTWMYRVALNVAITRQRSERLRRDHESLDVEHEDVIGALDVDVEARDQLELVQRAMQSLGQVDRALLLLQLEGFSQSETADVLGTSEGNVATRLNRIRNHLRRVAGASSNTGASNHGNA